MRWEKRWGGDTRGERALQLGTPNTYVYIAMLSAIHLFTNALAASLSLLQIIMPEMIGSVVGVYNGKTYIGVEIKAEMVGTYLAEYSMTYKPIKHGRPGIGATASSKFVPLK